MNETLVYTCITCKRDLLPPQTAIRGIDFTCYTEWLANDGWLSCELRRVYDCRLTARWHKLHPHIHSPNYKRWVWVDGHINVNDNILSLLNATAECDLAAFASRTVKDPYEELDIFSNKIGHHGIPLRIINNLRNMLLDANYPKKGGAHETTILILQNNTKVVNFLENWWRAMIKFECNRDQPHFDVLIRKLGLKLNTISGTVKNNEYFRWFHHYKKDPKTKLYDPQKNRSERDQILFN